MWQFFAIIFLIYRCTKPFDRLVVAMYNTVSLLVDGRTLYGLFVLVIRVRSYGIVCD